MQIFTLPKRVLRSLKPLLFFILFTGACDATFAQQSAGTKSNDIIADFKKANANRSEVQLKEAQAKIMKQLCPNHPSYKTAAKHPGANVQSNTAYESWRKNYPAEYEAYLKIFDFKY